MAQQAPDGSDDEIGYLALLDITVARAELGAAEMPNFHGNGAEKSSAPALLQTAVTAPFFDGLPSSWWRWKAEEFLFFVV